MDYWLFLEWFRQDLTFPVVGVLILLVIILVMGRLARRYPAKNIDDWRTLILGLEITPQEFYSALDETISKIQIPDGKRSPIHWHEGGMFSPKREYARFRRKEYVLDVCAAPYGGEFFVSWWLGETLSIFLYPLYKIPVVGPWIVYFLRRPTYYRCDTASMFCTAIHGAVSDTVRQICESKGLDRPSNLGTTPNMKDFFKK